MASATLLAIVSAWGVTVCLQKLFAEGTWECWRLNVPCRYADGHRLDRAEWLTRWHVLQLTREGRAEQRPAIRSSQYAADSPFALAEHTVRDCSITSDTDE